MTNPIRIAVVGGGIGGCALTLGLANARRAGANITFKLFEAAAQFKEIGAGVGVGPNAYRAIKLLGLEEPYSKLAFTHDLEESGVYFIWRWGEQHKVEENAGNDVIGFTPCHEKGGHTTVHRAFFLDMLIDRMPPDTVYFNKRISHYEVLQKKEPNDPAVRIHFVDGSIEEADILIAADGIKSTIRQQMLSDLMPEQQLKPRFTNTTVYRGLVPMEKLAARIGDKARKGTMFLGKNKHILVFPIEKGRIVKVVAFSSDRSEASANATWNDPAWIIPSTKEAMMTGWEDWSDDCKAILESLSSTDKWALHELHDFPTHTVGPVCILGDAAAGTLPHQGQGAAQAIESACTLANLFTCPGIDRSNSQAILQIFDEIRRERVTKVKTTSFELGKILEFADETIRDDPSLLQENLSRRYNWIWSWDGEAEIAKGIQRLQQVLQS